MSAVACASCRVCRLFPGNSYRDRFTTLLGNTWQSRQVWQRCGGIADALEARPQGHGAPRSAIRAGQGRLL